MYKHVKCGEEKERQTHREKERETDARELGEREREIRRVVNCVKKKMVEEEEESH